MKKITKIMGLIGLFIIIFGIPSSFAILDYQETYTSSTGTNKILILVNSAIYDAIYDPSLKQYISDLEAEDYNVTLTKFISGTPQELKDYIKLISGLKGVLFIGDSPVAEFEIADDKFPIDLFYMDLDGEWLDTDSNGVYDTHNPGVGDLSPEIWLGRLTASPLRDDDYFSYETWAWIHFIMDMDEVGCLKNYFTKNHAYRTGKLSVKQRALSYPDDDWAGFGKCNLDLAYSDVTAITDKATTTDTDYGKRLREDYEWIHVCVHSTHREHVFNNDWFHVFWFKEVRDTDPLTLFYNLFACSNCRYTESNYMGGHYIFTKTYGLAAVGSTKGGSMLGFEFFYNPLGPRSRKNLGEAFKDWFGIWDLSDLGYRGWFYGMTLLGDPTLSLDPPIASIDSIHPFYGDVDLDGKITSSDADLLSRYIAGIIKLSEPQKINGDVNGDGIIDSWDCTLISRYVNGIIKYLPASASQGQTITFTGSGKIIEGSITGYSWRSSIDGFLSSSSSFSTSSLSAGDHTIYFKVKDDKGRWSSEAKISLTISHRKNYPPIARILRIQPNPAYQGQRVYFAGYGKDKDGKVVGYEWKSSIDGLLSKSPYFSTNKLSIGKHTIYFKVKDNQGAWSEEVKRELSIIRKKGRR